MTRYAERRPIPGVVAVLLSLLLATAFMTGAAAQEATPVATPDGTPAATIDTAEIEPTPCATRYQLPESFVDGENISCGYLAVPAFPGDAGSPVIRLHVIELASTGPDPAEEPLIVLTGGPGQNGGSLLPIFQPPTDEVPISYAPLLERQDVILLDQRGTGASEPALTCPTDVIPLVQPPPAADGGTPVAATPVAATPAATPIGTPAGEVPLFTLPNAEQIAASTVQCLQAFMAAGIDLTAFTTENSAADVAALIGALGGQADLYGISYGSYLGQRVITDYPELVRSATLASIVSPDTDILLRQITGFDLTLTEIFELCAADADCAAANPDPDGDLRTAFDRLEAEPAVIEISDPASGLTAGIAFDGGAFLTMLYLLTFTSQPYGVPPVITQVAAGDDALLKVLAPLLVQPAGTSSGLLATMYCQDFADDVDIDRALSESGVRSTLAVGFTDSWRSLNLICDAVGLSAEPEGTDVVGSDVPTLLINGGLDPITRAEDADPVLAGLSAGQEVTFEVLGHDPGTVGGSCSVGVISDFVSDPTQPVDASCATSISLDMSPPGFYDEGEATPAATPAD